MRSSDNIFTLIKSLTKTEKRYFRLFSSRHIIAGKSIYQRMFSTIAGQKEYDENKIKAILSSENIGKNWAADKNRLYNLVLESLSSFYSNISVEAKSRNYIHQVEILFEKGLYEQGLKIIKKAKKYSLEKNNSLYTLDLLRLEKKLINVDHYHSDIERLLGKIYNEGFYLTRRYTRFLQLEQSLYKIFGFQMKEGVARDKHALKRLKVDAATVYKFSKRDDLDDIERRYCYRILGIYYRLIGKSQLSYQYQLREYSLYKRTPEDNTEMSYYMSCLHNLCLSQMEMLDYFSALETVKGLKEMDSNFIVRKSSRLRMQLFKFSAANELLIYNKIGDYLKGIQLMKTLEGEFEKYKSGLGASYVFVFSFTFAGIYIGAGNYKKALGWLHRITNHHEQNIRIDLQCFARIIELLIHYELRNEINLPYYVRSVYRYLFKKKHLFKFEKIIMEFIRRKIPRINSRKDLNKAFIELRHDLLLLKKDAYEAGAFNYFDFISWLESKIQRRSFAEIVQEKSKSPK